MKKKLVLAIFILSFVMVPVALAFNPFEGVSFIGGSGTSAISDPNLIIKSVITAALGVVGAVALVMFIYGGAMWMIARGNGQYVTTAKNTLIWSTLGLILVFGSYALTSYIFEVIGQVPAGGTAEGPGETSFNFVDTCTAIGGYVIEDPGTCDYGEVGSLPAENGVHCCQTESMMTTETCEDKGYRCVAEDFINDFVNCNLRWGCSYENICCEREKTSAEIQAESCEAHQKVCRPIDAGCDSLWNYRCPRGSECCDQ